MTIIEMSPQIAAPIRETTAPNALATSGYRVGLAAVRSEVLAVSRLRDLVFGLEGGATTPGPDGFDLDRFDDVCDHLVVWWSPDLENPEVQRIPVATYRLLPPTAAQSGRLGWYSATEFDLTPLESLLPQTVEAGRACVHPAHRNATTISLLWRGIARCMAAAGARYLLGCASFPDSDNGDAAAAFAARLTDRQLLDPVNVCRPLTPFPLPTSPGRQPVPPLIRGYLRLGARVAPVPAWDATFGSIDFLVLLDLETADQRYLDHFLGQAR